jgi:hypothetical protein
MGKLNNLKLAEAAVAYADGLLNGKSCNRPEDLQRQVQQAVGSDQKARQVYQDPSALAKLTKKIDQAQDTVVQQSRTGLNQIATLYYIDSSNLRSLADHVRSTGVGNCKEHCILACDWLKTVKGYADPLAIVTSPRDSIIDHVWVMMGFSPSIKSGPVPVNLKDGTDFGPDCVMADPWYHEWFSTADTFYKFRQVLKYCVPKGELLPEKEGFEFMRVD